MVLQFPSGRIVPDDEEEEESKDQESSMQHQLLPDGPSSEDASAVESQDSAPSAVVRWFSPMPVSTSTGLSLGLDRTFWLMFALLSLVLVLAESSRGIVIPTLALYQKSLGGDNAFLGGLVAVFSVGRLASSYIFAKFMKRSARKAANTPNPRFTSNHDLVSALLFSLLIVLLGHTLYIAASAGGLSLLLVARLLVGFGTGTLVLARTFVGDYVAAKRKARFMSWLGVEQFIGFAFTPGLGSASVDAQMGPLTVTRYNFGSYLLGFLSMLAAGGLLYAQRRMTKDEEQAQRSRMGLQGGQSGSVAQLEGALPNSNSAQEPSASSSGESRQAAVPSVMPAQQHVLGAASAAAASAAGAAPLLTASFSVDGVSPSVSSAGRGSCSCFPRSEWPLWVLVLSNLVVRGSLSVAETFGSLIYFIVVTPNDPDQVTDSSVFFLLLGVGGVCVFLMVEYLLRCVPARWLLCGALSVAVCGYGLLMDWDGDLAQMQFIAGMILVWSVSSPIAQTVIASQLSIELEERAKQERRWREAKERETGVVQPAPPPSQAMWMANLTAAGSIGRILFPLIGGTLYSSTSSGGVMLLCLMAHVVALAAFLVLSITPAGTSRYNYTPLDQNSPVVVERCGERTCNNTKVDSNSNHI
jgi:hypothetical protein